MWRPSTHSSRRHRADRRVGHLRFLESVGREREQFVIDRGGDAVASRPLGVGEQGSGIERVELGVAVRAGTFYRVKSALRIGSRVDRLPGSV